MKADTAEVRALKDAAIREWKLADNRYSEACRKIAKVRIACDYPGAPDAALAIYHRARQEFKVESKLYFKARQDFQRAMREARPLKEIEYSPEEYIAMDDASNMQVVNQTAQDYRKAETMPAAIADAMKLAQMTSEQRQRFINSKLSVAEFLEHESEKDSNIASIEPFEEGEL